MPHTLELLLARDGEQLFLRSPEVGLFTQALPAGACFAPGARAGLLHALGRCHELVVPSGAAGRIVSERPEGVLFPVGYGTRLYEYAPFEAGEVRAAALEDALATSDALVFRAPYSGRFWQRPAPGDPPFVQAGDVLADGQTLGLIEVMKTFTHVVYHMGGALPARARIARFLAADGAEVESGAALLELESA